ncbi:MAG: hypothetical protein E7242_05515 [Lachnospiraceae bacterium]|nr:hypothetical protein [Lachnospiraceae bacterium]
MKGKFLKKTLTLVFAGAMLLATLAGCGGEKSESGAQAESKGTIMWLSNLTSGINYETNKNWAEAICKELGYELKIVYGDMFNDPDGNLQAVKNGMTNDVVGIISSQDGGIGAIMKEYPDLYVAGFGTDMNSVYSDNPQFAVNADVLNNDKWLGTIADGHINGKDLAKEDFDYVKAQGWTKIGVITFPGYAYPNLEEASNEIQSLCAEAGIEIVGGVTTLQFQPLEESYFQEAGRDKLDGIVALCAGTQFVYPTMQQAVADGLCSADTKLVTGGFDDDQSIISDIGGDGTIQYISFSPAENIAYALILLDNAINDCQYPDFKPERFESVAYVIDSKEDIDNVMTKSMAGTADVSLSQMSLDDVKNLCVRFNPDATHADLMSFFLSDQLTTDALKSR